jgi:cell division protein FtsI (penicillin-binding protein 3)
VIVALLVVIGWKVADLQVFNNDVLQREGDARTLRNESMVATRGNIVDRHGEPLAISTPVSTLWLNPKEVLQHPEQGEQLAEAITRLGLNARETQKRILDNASREFMYLKRRIPPAEAEEILSLRLKGLYAQQEYKRFYPMGEAAVQLVGLTNNEEEGQEGLEMAYQEWLKGTPGKHQVLKDRIGRIVRDLGVTANAVPGHDLHLSIDSRLQYLAYKAVKEAVAMRNAKAGTATVLDARTGEVLAMVSLPSYNPNNRTNMNNGGLINRAMADLLEPGSTVKTFTITAALESGLFDTNTIVDTSPGVVVVDRRRLEDPVNYGPSSLARIVAKSSQVGAIKIGLTIGHERMLDVLKRVGFGEAIGTGFPGESTGVLPSHDRWSKGDTAALAYGYGFQVTPLQLAQAYLVYANRGIRKSVSFIKDAPRTEERVIDAGIAEKVVQMLRGVVSKEMGGTAVGANIPSYDVAGKSGTTWYYDVNRGYDDNNYITHFAGFAPVDNPRVVIVVTIQQPQGEETGGGKVSAPVFSQIAAGAMRILDVPPQVSAIPPPTPETTSGVRSAAPAVEGGNIPEVSPFRGEPLAASGGGAQ